MVIWEPGSKRKDPGLMVYLDHRGSNANPLKTYTYGGNLLKVKQALTRAFSDTHRDNKSESLLLFGYPGVGKSSLVDSALKDLIDASKLNMDIVEINCANLIGAHANSDKALTELQKICATYLKHLPDLRVFVLDETEAIGLARHLSGASGKISMCFFCMNSLRRKDKRVVWLLITNYPNLVDPGIVNYVGKRLYLPCPDKTAATVIIQEFLNSTDTQKLLNNLTSNQREFALNVRALDTGLNFLKECGKINGNQLHGCNPKEAADIVEGGGGFPANTEISDYEDMHKILINQSRLLMKAYGI